MNSLLCDVFVDVISAEPEPDSSPAESEPAEPESEGAPAGQNPQPTGQRAQLHHYDDISEALHVLITAFPLDLEVAQFKNC